LIASYCPVPLTSMTQPVDKIADAVIDLMTERFEERLDGFFDEKTQTPRIRTIVGDLVIRDSVMTRSSP